MLCQRNYALAGTHLAAASKYPNELCMRCMDKLWCVLMHAMKHELVLCQLQPAAMPASETKQGCNVHSQLCGLQRHSSASPDCPCLVFEANANANSCLVSVSGVAANSDSYGNCRGCYPSKGALHCGGSSRRGCLSSAAYPQGCSAALHHCHCGRPEQQDHHGE